MSDSKEKKEAKANLGFLSVLVVEDNNFMRLIFMSVLRTIGIENIATANNGAEAIKVIEEKSRSVPLGTPPFDLIFLDLLMPEVNGFMTLRWIRSSAQTPDRFVPVIVTSGAADRPYVEQSRDAGMNEFVSKPYSTQAVWDRLMGVLYRSRRFVLAPGYFGPDRRRAKKTMENDRRIANEAEIQIIRSSTTKVKMDSATVVYFDFPNRLTAKVGGLAPGVDIPRINPEIISMVEAKVNEMAGDYSTWVASEITRLADNLNKLREPGANVRLLFQQINASAHEMRSQGGLFGYPLVTDVCKSLFLYTNKNAAALSDNEFELLKAHVDAVRVIIGQKIGGDGGDTGKALLTGLQAAIKKYA